MIASSPYGSADLQVGSSGEWLLKLWMHGVPAGSGFNVEVSNTASGDVYEFWVATPAAEPEPDPEPAVAFSANAVYLTCDLDPPYNDFWGTAQPGTTIKVLSPYGSAEFTVGESGNWEKRVFFESAPIGETFTVKVKS